MILLTTTRKDNGVKTFLLQKLSYQGLGNLKYSSNIEMGGSSQGIYLCRGKYILDLPDELECREVNQQTPRILILSLERFSILSSSFLT